MKFHHLGVATQDLMASLDFIKSNFEDVKHTDIVYDTLQDASIIMVSTRDLSIELVSGNIVKNIISKRQSYYHICYEVDDLDKSIAEFQQSIVISKPTKAILFNNRRVAFIMTPIGIIELLESREQLDENRVG